MTKPEAQQLVAKHGGIQPAARAVRCSPKTIRAALAGLGGSKPSAPAALPALKRTMRDFAQTFDKNTYVPEKIKVALRKLGAEWRYEIEFAKDSGVSITDLKLFGEQFAANLIELRGGRRAWFGRASDAETARKML